MSAPSAPQLVFEGPDPERLLLEAWSVHGTQVRISEPVIVRRGGVAGFFAKAHYRIEVIPGSGASHPDTTEVPRAAGDEVLETVVASLHATGAGAGAPVVPLVRPDSPPPGPPLPPAPAQLAPAAATAPTSTTPPAGPLPSSSGGTTAALAGLVDATEDEVNLHSSRRPSFEEVLGKVASSLGEDPARLAGALPADPAPAAPNTRVASSPPAPSAAQPVEPAPAPLVDRLSSAALERPVVRSRPWGEEVETAPDPSEDAARRAREGLREQLALVGFPQALLAEATSPPRSLLEAFALAPAPRALPKTPGSLIAVVGSLPVARGIAAQLGLPTSEVARARRARGVGEGASSHLVHDEREAADLAPGWRRDRVGVVAVTLTSLSRDGAWARAVLRAMGPSMTIALASATMKGEDVRAFCSAIGGVDALVVEDLEATLTPAAVLGTGIPIGMLDGMPADPATWVDVATRALARRSAAEA